MHRRRDPVVHRDLKPENILVNKDDNPVIIDFGICFFEDGERQTLTEEVAGARHYTAPELEVGRANIVPTADVYSLGKLLYWLCSDRHLPREMHRNSSLDLSLINGDPRFELINNILDRSIQELPEKRFKDASAFLDEFRKTKRDFSLVNNVPSPHAKQSCIYCGIGTYIVVGGGSGSYGASDNHALQINAGITAYNSEGFRSMVCDHCGNIQNFHVSQLKVNMNPWIDHK